MPPARTAPASRPPPRPAPGAVPCGNPECSCLAPRPGARCASAPPRWAIHRRLYDWVLSLAHHPHALTALFLLSFAESSFFPVPPDVLQIALTLERRGRAFLYAAVSTVASILGALAGYGIGWGLWHLVSGFFFRYVFSEATFERVVAMYQENAFSAVFLAAFTPIPYKVFTIAGGVCHISMATLVAASVVGRGGRFFLLAGLLYIFGPPVKRFIDRYFNLLCIALAVLGIGGFIALQWL